MIIVPAAVTTLFGVALLVLIVGELGLTGTLESSAGRLGPNATYAMIACVVSCIITGVYILIN